MAPALAEGHIGSVQVLLSVQGGSAAAFYPLVLLHVAAALSGFGSIGFAGTYASRAVQMALTGAPGADQGELTPTPVAASTGGETAQTAALPRLSAGLPPGDGAPADPEEEELVRYFQRPARFWKALFVVPVFGALALWAEPGGGGLDQVWDICALLVWSGAVLVAAGVVVPGLREVQRVLVGQPPTSSGAGTSGAGGEHEHSSPLVVPSAQAPAELVGTPRAGEAPPRAWATEANRARLVRYGRLASRGAAACDLLFFGALALMIWRP